MDVSQKATFIFGDGNSKTCTGKAAFPLKIAGVEGELEINIWDADARLLIGVDVLSRLGAVIDCEAHSVYFKKLGRRAQLLVLPSGHLALPHVEQADVGFAAALEQGRAPSAPTEIARAPAGEQESQPHEEGRVMDT